jgi:ADP-dependent NAD(P)H-hydrate dehydratase / NAD(P)H-hydrate epimerase
MKPVLFAAEMAEVDAAALSDVTIEVLIERAGWAVARRAFEMLQGTYGSRVLVVAGKGHNGDDGRVAAKLLARRGAKVRVVAPGELGEVPKGTDLVVDAAFGTGFHGSYAAPRVPDGVPVLAVDIPSGLGADLGEATDGATKATSTVTFAALKPGLLLGAGPDLVGSCVVEPIGLAVPPSRLNLVEDLDLDEIPRRDRAAHKWKSAVFVLAGSPGMRGAPDLSVAGALRAGAGMIRVATPGVSPGASGATEAVAIGLERSGFASVVLAEVSRCRALVAGPGLGSDDAVRAALFEILEKATVPVVLDADALNMLGGRTDAAALLRRRGGPTVLTPHDGEFARLTGGPPGADRVGEVRALAAEFGATVLLKGSTTVIADESGATLLVTSGTPRLATAGSGDVLSGVIGAMLARGLPPLRAAGIGAHLHGRAARTGLADGLLAGDLPLLVAGVLSSRLGD